jgi:BirA family biotin operon repressor/biotin-[acetyl-CoA-carboxylase] ligase
MRRLCWQAVAWTVEWVAETGSTNADLLEAARAGAPAGTVLVADHQTAGRGRLGRQWHAPPGSSLLASILFHAPDPAALHYYTQAVGLAAVDACHSVAAVTPVLKWPNDLLVGDRKLAGVLAESAPTESAPTHSDLIAVVVGIGLNVNWPAELPVDLAKTMTALNHEAGHDIDRREVLDALLDALDALDWTALAPRYRAALATIGRRVRVEQPSGSIEGVAVDVTPDGHLVVATSAGDIAVSAGDVMHLRDAPA